MGRREAGTCQESSTLGDSTGWLEEVLLAFSHAVIVCDPDGGVVFLNQAAEELCGISRKRAVGRPCAEVLAGFPVAAEMVRRVTRTGQGESYEGEPFRQGEHSIPVRVSCAAVALPGGRCGAALVVHDRTQQVALEEAARRSESLARLGSVVAGLAHEVRNPLAGIKGAAQLLARRLEREPELAEYTTVITREVERLSRLVEDLLALGKTPPPAARSLNIHRALERVLTLMAPELKARNIHVERDFDPSLPEIAGDEDQLTQAFLNLLRNSVESMAANGPARFPDDRLCLRTKMETDFRVVQPGRAPTRFLRVEVLDSGSGIAPGDAARVFEPFFTTKPQGTGLGLTIASRIIAAHGGLIRVEPRDSRGVRVIVTLPVPVEERDA